MSEEPDTLTEPAPPEAPHPDDSPFRMPPLNESHPDESPFETPAIEGLPFDRDGVEAEAIREILERAERDRQTRPA